MEWDPEAYYFDALSNRHYGKFINDAWSDEGNNCKIKWNPYPITADITTEANWNTQWQLESTRDITYAPQAHTQCQPINNLYLIGSDTSY